MQKFCPVSNRAAERKEIISITYRQLHHFHILLSAAFYLPFKIGRAAFEFVLSMLLSIPTLDDFFAQRKLNIYIFMYMYNEILAEIGIFGLGQIKS